MSLLTKLFGSKTLQEQRATEHAVIVHFAYGSTNLQYVYALEDLLRNAISEAGAGEYDGHEVDADGSEGFFYMFGPDAETLFRVISPVLATVSFMRGARITLRYGPSKMRTPKRVIVLPH